MIKFPCVFAIFIALICAGCSTGSHVITGKARPSISPEAVQVYPSIPAGAEIIGVVSAEVDRFLITVQGGSDRGLVKLKAEAGKIGANGIVVQNTYTVPPSYGSSGSVNMSAQAIFVP